ncbi:MULTISPECIES: helix-turn-helix domain-containing protein [Enterobacterales]|nr:MULTISPECIES: helix-turn-helix transcriptional regulator [Enterobacterales]TRY00861.1 helix-turn-helix transcriptional regulator [Proteus mirabilis]
MNDINEKLGLFLRKERILNSLSGAELAEILNISQQQVSRYERGQHNFTVKFLIFYCKALHISLDKLITHVFLSESDIEFNAIYTTKFRAVELENSINNNK